jgi:hypothetical protein
MALSFGTNPFHITSELGATQDLTVNGLSYYDDPDNCALILYVKINGVTVKTLSVEPTAASYTFYNIDFSSVKSAIYSEAEGSNLSGCVTVQAVNTRFVLSASINATTSAGNLTIAARNSALVTTANIIDMALADPANLAFSWTRPHTAFRARIKFYVYNGSSYDLIFSRYGFDGTSSSGDLKNYGGTDYTSAIVAAMNGSSPRNYKVELYTQFVASSIVDIGSLNDSDIITNGMEYPFGGKIKAFATAFSAKPLKWWNGTSWLEKPLKHWTGSEWKKSKN